MGLIHIMRVYSATYTVQKEQEGAGESWYGWTKAKIKSSVVDALAMFKKQ